MLRDRDAAEDCTQEAFARAYKAWPRWRPDAPAEAWLHRIAINTAISYKRREKPTGILSDGTAAPQGTDPDGRAALLAALRTLSPEHAAVLVLRHNHGYSNREIAIALGTNESTVGSRLAAARSKLMVLLDWDTATSDDRTVVTGRGELRPATAEER